MWENKLSWSSESRTLCICVRLKSLHKPWLISPYNMTLGEKLCARTVHNINFLLNFYLIIYIIPQFTSICRKLYLLVVLIPLYYFQIFADLSWQSSERNNSTWNFNCSLTIKIYQCLDNYIVPCENAKIPEKSTWIWPSFLLFIEYFVACGMQEFIRKPLSLLRTLLRYTVYTR